MPDIETTYNFPVYRTQGGGLARVVGGIAIFVTDQKFPGLSIGSEVPREWDLQPANQLARDKMAHAGERREELCDLDYGLAESSIPGGHWVGHDFPGDR